MTSKRHVTYFDTHGNAHPTKEAADAASGVTNSVVGNYASSTDGSPTEFDIQWHEMLKLQPEELKERLQKPIRVLHDPDPDDYTTHEMYEDALAASGGNLGKAFDIMVRNVQAKEAEQRAGEDAGKIAIPNSSPQKERLPSIYNGTFNRYKWREKNRQHNNLPAAQRHIIEWFVDWRSHVNATKFALGAFTAMGLWFYLKMLSLGATHLINVAIASVVVGAFAFILMYFVVRFVFDKYYSVTDAAAKLESNIKRYDHGNFLSPLLEDRLTYNYVCSEMFPGESESSLYASYAKEALHLEELIPNHIPSGESVVAKAQERATRTLKTGEDIEWNNKKIKSVLMHHW